MEEPMVLPPAIFFAAMDRMRRAWGRGDLARS